MHSRPEGGPRDRRERSTGAAAAALGLTSTTLARRCRPRDGQLPKGLQRTAGMTTASRCAASCQRCRSCAFERCRRARVRSGDNASLVPVNGEPCYRCDPASASSLVRCYPLAEVDVGAAAAAAAAAAACPDDGEVAAATPALRGQARGGRLPGVLTVRAVGRALAQPIRAEWVRLGIELTDHSVAAKAIVIALADPNRPR